VREASARLDVLPIIVEKDFWVCWMLQRIFQPSPAGARLVFKGGTSLSKVFGAIKRFSEDSDLSIAPELLGWKESDLDDAPSRSHPRKIRASLCRRSGPLVTSGPRSGSVPTRFAGAGGETQGPVLRLRLGELRNG
jgi:Nucleotidyl transferase AbiEii toxin, Type IV TA system